MKLRVIYEDNHLLVCEKPENMPVQADSSGDIDLLTLAKEYIKDKYNKPGDVFLGLVHRLDRPVGGVIVFARTSKAAARLTESFKKRTTKKEYAAIVTGNPRDYGYLKDYLIRNEDSNTTAVVPEGTPGAKEASLNYACVTRKNGLSLMDISLHSGRHHQIRVQLKNAGCPIYGDQRYNPTARAGQQIALYAYSLTIEHPTLKTEMRFMSFPRGGAWDQFKDEVAALGWGIRLRYVDENIIVVNKRAGIACAQADVENIDNSEASVESMLCCALNTNEIYPVHRLDVLTSGLVLFARNRKAEQELLRLIKQRAIRKTYHAELFGVPEKSAGRLKLYAVKDSQSAKVTVYDDPVPGSVEMISDYRVISSNSSRSIVEIELVTGRTHQIRASFAHIGTPIVGDDKYGDRILNRSNKTGLHLAATDIEFPKVMEVLSYLSGIKIENDAEFELNSADSRL